MKIGFITDTNILKKTDKDLHDEELFLNNIDFFLEYINDLKASKSKDKLVYIMPDIVIKELYNQKIRAFNETYNNMIKVFDTLNYGIEGVKPKNIIEKALDKEVNKYEKLLSIIELGYSKELFEEMVNDALKRNPPFDKTKEGYKEDSGFKDSLIWKTILYCKEIDNFDKIYLFSGDGVFEESKEALIKEFKEKHQKTELIIKCVKPDGEQRQNCLQTIIIENRLIETDIIKLYSKAIVEKYIRKITYNYKEKIYYYTDKEKYELQCIDFKQFENDDFYISKVWKENEEYLVVIEFNTDKYKLKNYDEKKEKISGELLITFKKNGNNFEMVSNSINSASFVENSLKRVLEYIKIEYDTNLKQLSENLIDSTNINYYKKVIDFNQIRDTLIKLGNISNPFQNFKINKVLENIKPLTIGDYFDIKDNNKSSKDNKK